MPLDKGKADLGLFNQWCNEWVTFITRKKGNASYDVVARRNRPKYRAILRDEIIEFNGNRSQEKRPSEHRRIEMWDAENEQTLVFLTGPHLSKRSLRV